jgi:FKBP-type peptidyl-prolyl cis-trans isomerase FklB
MKKTSRLSLLQVSGAFALFSVPLISLAQAPNPAAPPANAPPPGAPPAGGSTAAAAGPSMPSAAEGGYLIGLSFGAQIHGSGVTNEISAEDIARGVRDALAGKPMTQLDAQRLQLFGKSVMDGVQARRKVEADKNKAAGDEFLAKNAHQKGVHVTASGLQYEIVIPGNAKAASPGPEDTVTVNYRGKLIDNTEFDSSYARNEPISFPVSGVIKGWTEALQLMKPGAKWKLWVPADLAYGAQAKGAIPPDSTLIFEVELLSVKKNETPPAAAAPTPPPPAPATQQ